MVKATSSSSNPAILLVAGYRQYASDRSFSGGCVRFYYERPYKRSRTRDFAFRKKPSHMLGEYRG